MHVIMSNPFMFLQIHLHLYYHYGIFLKLIKFHEIVEEPENSSPDSDLIGVDTIKKEKPHMRYDEDDSMTVKMYPDQLNHAIKSISWIVS